MPSGVGGVVFLNYRANIYFVDINSIKFERNLLAVGKYSLKVVDMNSVRSIIVRVMLLMGMVFSAAGAGPAVRAQTPQPVLSPENDPAAFMAPAPVRLPQPAAFGGSPQAALAPTVTIDSDDRYNTTVTGWAVYLHQSPTDVANTINTGLRPIDITVETFSPSYLFTVVYVANAGAYNKGFYWYYGVDETTLNNAISSGNARIISLKPYDIGGGQIRFAAVLISNTGADATAWYWYYGQSTSSLSALWASNHARITRVTSYVSGGQTYYAAVMVDNQNANYRGWYWYVNQSPASVSSLISTTGARLVDLDRDSTTGNFNIVLDVCGTSCPMWWWYYGVDTSQLLNIALQNGARLIDATTYAGCSGTCWAFLLINNSNAITSRVGEMLRSRTDGSVGLYLKQVNGPVLANLMDTTSFEPASTIKAAVHLYALRSVQAGTTSMATQIPKYFPPASGSCPISTVNGTEDLTTADREMMWHSDNTRTLELTNYYGTANINQMLNSLGMTSTSINHIIGCGGPIPDVTTLDNLARLYEGVATATFVDATRRALFYSQMAGKAEFAAEGYDWTGLWSTDIPNIINAEAPVGMPQALKTAFRNKMELAYKAGNYKICTNINCSTYVDHISIFGHAQVPFCDTSGPRQYVFGEFIYNATSDANSSNAFTATKAELLREQIHAGLASCFHQVYLPATWR